MAKAATAGTNGNGKPPAEEMPAPVEEREQYVPKAKYDELLGRLDSMERSFHALERSNTAAATTTAQPNADDAAETIAKQLGGDPKEVREWKKFLSPFFDTMFNATAAPYLNALNIALDRIDALEAETRIPDYKDFASDIERVRQDNAAANRYVSRNDAYHVVRSQRFPQMLEAERERLRQERAERVEGAAAGTTDTAETAGTVPRAKDPTAAGRPLTADEFAKLSLEEKENYLSDKAF